MLSLFYPTVFAYQVETESVLLPSYPMRIESTLHAVEILSLTAELSYLCSCWKCYPTSVSVLKRVSVYALMPGLHNIGLLPIFKSPKFEADIQTNFG